MCGNITSNNIREKKAEIIILRREIAILDKTIARLKTELYTRVNIVYNFKQDRGEAL